MNESYDDHIHTAFRVSGFTREALKYPLSDQAYAWLLSFNGITTQKVPWQWRYAPNAYMQGYLQQRASANE